jgi:ribonucleoside-triphosphate reductase (thioredoxin)
LLPGVTPGIHYPHAKHYFRTIRIDRTSPLVEPIRRAGYRIEDSVYGDNTFVVYFPVAHKDFDRSKIDVSIWEQVENIAQMQYYWADNQVSATVTFTKDEAKSIPYILELYETRLKSISFLPLLDHNYPQAPYQEIAAEVYEQAAAKLKPLDFSRLNTKEAQDIFCDGDKCEVRPTPEHFPEEQDLPFNEAESPADKEPVGVGAAS